MHDSTSREIRTPESKRGSVLIVFVFALPILLGAASLMVDMGYVYMANSQLQVAADAGALAGVYELTLDDQSAARQQAANLARANHIVGEEITIDAGSQDIQVGRWEGEAFVPNGPKPNAVRVTLRRTHASADGPLPLFFGPAVGLDSVELTASATARLAAVDLALVLDTSSSMTHDTYYSQCTRWVGSMCGCGTAPNGYQPFDSLTEAAESFVDNFDEYWDQLALVTYANTAKFPINEQLTHEHEDVGEEIVELPVPNYCNGTRYTNIGDGIRRGRGELISSRARASARKLMVLLSDGRPTCNSSGTCNGNNDSIVNQGRTYARSKATEARNSGIVIYTISFGDDADLDLMQDIADITHGEHFVASETTDLDATFEEILRRIPIQLTR